jgi:hypothetical protein
MESMKSILTALWSVLALIGRITLLILWTITRVLETVLKLFNSLMETLFRK